MLLKVGNIEAGMNRWGAALRLVGVGFFIGGSIFLGLWVGLYVDSRLNASLFWIVGLLLGIVVAFYGVYRMLLPLMSNKGDKENS